MSLIITKETDIRGVLNGDRNLILKQGNMSSISVFRIPSTRDSTIAHIRARGYVNRLNETYSYEEVDRLATLYPFVCGHMMKYTNDLLKTMGFDVKVRYCDSPVQTKPKPILEDKEFIAMARQLGCHNFYTNEDGCIYIAIKGIREYSRTQTGVTMKDIMSIGASRSLYCKIMAYRMGYGRTKIPFGEVVK